MQQYSGPDFRKVGKSQELLNRKTGTLANSEDPDEMQPNAAFHQGLHYLPRLKQPSETEIHYNLENITCDPLKCTMDSPMLIISSAMYGKIHQNTV